MGVKLVVDQYVGDFYRRDTGTKKWVDVGRVGNAGVALDFVDILRKLDIKVDVEDISEDGDA